MAQSLSKVYTHITFSRYPFIDNEIKQELWAYIIGGMNITKNEHLRKN